MKSFITAKDGIFTINTQNTTYQMKTDQFNNLIHLYYGRKTDGIMDYWITPMYHPFSDNPYYVGSDRGYSMDNLPLEFSTGGTGDTRSVAFEVKYADSSWGTELHVMEWKITDSKYSIPGLPAVWQKAGGEAQTLEITLFDDVRKVQVQLLYGVIPEFDIITRSAVVTNCGKETFSIEKISSCCLDFASGEYDIIHFHGCWVNERNLERERIEHSLTSVSTKAGSSSHKHSPFAIICDKNTTENSGDCWGASFVYSGNFRIEAEKNQYGMTRFMTGINDEYFSYPLKSGESFHAPEVILSFSSGGFNSLSHNFHDVIKNNLTRSQWKDKTKPILINSWEACYFNFNGDVLVDLGKRAAELGIEMLVMDDGWFGHRDDDSTSLGDWKVNEKKLGCTLKELVDRINALGLKFGIWFEPEMISEDSDLYREHPDYVLCFPGRKPVRGRNELVLDFSRKEVVDCIYGQMTAILDSANIEYVKWDFNRNLNDIWSAKSDSQGKVFHDYVLGVYSLLERLTERYPDILFEGCSGGGGRFDAGMLYYVPQIWASDNTDALDRTNVQYGTSYGFPVSSMGSHVSICPNHMTQRSVSMHTRGIVAMSGSFGYELDLSKITEEEKNEIREQIGEFKKYVSLIHSGDYYRLSDPKNDPAAAWQIVSKGKEEFVVSYMLKEWHGYLGHAAPVLFRLCGLEENAFYKETGTGKVYPANALMQTGYAVKEITEPFQAGIIHFEKVK